MYANDRQATRCADSSAGAISDIAIISLTPSRLVTALLNGSGNFALIVSDFLSGNVLRKGASTAGSISNVAITPRTNVRAMRKGHARGR
jgi:hypothetical protein